MQQKSFSGYWVGIGFFITSLLVGSTNDVIMRFMGERLSGIEVIFFRFFFGLVTLIPFMIPRGVSIFKTSCLGLNLLRALLGFVAMIGCAYGVILLPLAEFTTIFWTIPLFTLVLSYIFLREKITSARWIATLIGFLGLTVLTCPGGVSFKMVALIPITSAFLFSIQDVIMKCMVVNEDRLTMLFYFALGTTILGIVPVILVWQTPTFYELASLFALGAGGNLIQYFLFKAFAATELSALAPFRYADFIFSSLFGLTFFGEVLNQNAYIGAAILIPSTLYLVYSESRKVSCISCNNLDSDISNTCSGKKKLKQA